MSIRLAPKESGDDVALLRSAARGDRDAVGRLLDEVGPVVYGFVYARVGGDVDVADDLMQETLVEAVRSAHTFRGEAKLTSWMCTIARRRIARYYENERREAVARAGLSIVEEAETPAEDPTADRDEVIRALGRLPALHRQVLVLKYLDDLPVEKIAADLGRSRTSVQSLLQRARARLRHELQESGA